MNILFGTIQKRILVSVMAITMLFGMAAFAPKAEAQIANTSANDRLAALQMQIDQLSQIVTQLIAMIDARSAGGGAVGENSTEGGFMSRAIGISDTVQTTDSLKVRSSASAQSALRGVQRPFAQGEVVAGPRYSDGYTWWQIRYNNGQIGWSAENWLRQIKAGQQPDADDGENNSNEEASQTDQRPDENYNCRSTAPCPHRVLGNNIFDVDFDGTYIRTYTDVQGNNPGAARFYFEFNIEAEDRDMYIKKDSFNPFSSVGDKIAYTREGRIILSVQSEADEEIINGEEYYYLAEGENAWFRVVHDHDVLVEGEYAAILQRFDFRQYRDGRLYRAHFDRIETDEVALEGISEAEWMNEDQQEDSGALQAMIDDLVEQVANMGGEANEPSDAERDEMNKTELENETDRLLNLIAELEEDASDDYLMVKSSSNDPDATTFELDDSNNSDWYTIFKFVLEASDENEVDLEEIVLDFDLFDERDGVVVQDILDNIDLNIDGSRAETEYRFTSRGQLVAFILSGEEVTEGEEVEVEVRARFEPSDSPHVTNGMGFKVSVESVQANSGGSDFLAEGTAESERHTLIHDGPIFEFDDGDAELEPGGSDQGNFTLEFELTALGSDLYIPNQVSNDLENEDNGFYFHFYNSGLPEVDGWRWTADVESSADEDNGQFIVEEDNTESFTLTVRGTPEQVGTYRVALAAIQYFVDGAKQSDLQTLGLGNTNDTPSIFINAPDDDIEDLEDLISGLISQVEDANARIVTNYTGHTVSVNQARAYYEIEMDVTAVDADIYIKKNGAIGTTIQTDSGGYGRGTRDVLLESTAEEDVPGIFKIAEGDTETFVVTITFMAFGPDRYRAGISEINYGLSASDPASTEMELDWSDYQTQYVYLTNDLYLR